MPSQPLDETFVRNVHRALRHMYEPVELRLSPLVMLLRLDKQADVSSALRKNLLDAIHALEPGPKVPAESSTRRIYQVLCYRFEEQFSQEEVASQMAVSSRQVRRLEFVAIRALADYLSQQYGLLSVETPAEQAVDPSDLPVSSQVDVLEEQPGQAEGTGQESEFDWLKKSYQREVTDIHRLVETALKTGEAMLRNVQVEVVTELPLDLPPVVGQMTTLRQALLNFLIAGLRSCPRGTVHVRASHAAEQVCLDIWAEWNSEGSQPENDVTEFLEMGRRLAELSRGKLAVQPASSHRPFAVRLWLQVAERYSVLFIDDNDDSLRLMQRYLTGTQFAFYGVRDTERVMGLAEECAPRVILLDIMLPEIDGWELLGRLRAHPTLGGVPVIISTILPHQQLAASLGAAGFLRKPVSREALLQALDQQIVRSGPESR